MISVIMPTTRGDLVPRALRSIATQEVAEDIEVLLLRDGGPALEAGEWPFSVRSLGITPRLGPAGARNAAAILSRGALLAFLDDDDEWLPGHLSSLLDVVRTTGGLAFSDAEFLHEAEHWTAPFRFRFHPEILRSTNPIILSGAAMPRSAFLAVGGFDADLPAYEAWDLFLRLAQAGVPLQRVPSVTLRYHFSPRSTTADDARMRDAFKQFRDKHGLGELARASFAAMLLDPRWRSMRES